MRICVAIISADFEFCVIWDTKNVNVKKTANLTDYTTVISVTGWVCLCLPWLPAGHFRLPDRKQPVFRRLHLPL